jgi:4-amino-4-deoxy-L-arabinose transferase-like glycosyltransferase
MKVSKLLDKITEFSRKNPDILIITLLCIFLPLFLFNLKGFSLVDFDEAWYASIAKNILSTKNPILLTFNGSVYQDHPFVGFNLMAISMAIFGGNEFGARFPSAILGFSSVILVYLVGKNLFSRTIGLMSSLVLVSCVWFIFRSRTANLDTILLFFYLFTFYSAVKATKNSRWLSVFGLSLFATLLTKSVIGLTVIPPIIIIFTLRGFKYKPNKMFPHFLFLTIAAVIILLAIVIINGQNFFHTYLSTGLKSTGKRQIDFLQIKNSLTVLYLHYGIRKWFYLAILSLAGSIFLIRKNFILIALYAWLFVLFYGFLSNSKTEIWHLIPLYPVLALFIAFFTYNFTHVLISLLVKITNYKNKKTKELLFKVLPMTLIFLASIYQIYNFIGEIKLFDKSESPIAYLSTIAKSYPENLYLDSDVVVPAVAVFYSGKHVVIFRNQSDLNTLDSFVLKHKEPLILITETWRLNSDKVPLESYQVLAEKEGHVLIKPKQVE